LQTALGDRVGHDVHIISVSTDPVTDTPEKLKAWAARLKAKDGWTLVTGEKAKLTVCSGC
jgi:protein SCO1/2